MLIENLVVYTRKPYEDSKGREIHHSFPLPKESEQYVAQHWSGWDKKDGTANMIDFESFDKKFPVFKGVELIDLDHRGNGGRAYQVLIPFGADSHSYMRCDMREDALFDAMMLAGVEKGGNLNGEFAFIRNGAQTNLVPVGSKVYEKHAEMAERKSKSKKISNKDLKIGYVYSTPNGNEEVYLGVYYQHGGTWIENSSSKVDDKPTAYHVFSWKHKYINNYSVFKFRKSHSFTVESDKPSMSESEAEQCMKKHYVDYAENQINKYLSEIENVYIKWNKCYEISLRTIPYSHLQQAKEELVRLRRDAFEAHRQNQTSATKSEVNYDKKSFLARVKESEAIAMEKVKDKGFI